MAAKTGSPAPSLPAWVRRRLLSGCVVLLTMVMDGAVTRLTESGLSIVDWKPVTGVLPPIGETSWQRIVSPEESPSAR